MPVAAIVEMKYHFYYERW